MKALLTALSLACGQPVKPAPSHPCNHPTQSIGGFPTPVVNAKAGFVIWVCDPCIRCAWANSALVASGQIGPFKSCGSIPGEGPDNAGLWCWTTDGRFAPIATVRR